MKARLQDAHPEMSCKGQTRLLLSAINLTFQTQKLQLVSKSVRCSKSTTQFCFNIQLASRWLVKTFHFPPLYRLHIPVPCLFSTLSLLEERAGNVWEYQSNENFCLTVINIVCHKSKVFPLQAWLWPRG